MSQFDYVLKILMVGDSCAGKSSLLRQFVDHTFDSLFISTIGVDFRVIQRGYGDKKCQIQLWDTSGNERYKTIVSSYYRGAHGVVLVYDTTNKPTLLKLTEQVAEIRMYTEAPILLCGTKSDERSFTGEVDLSHKRVSARTGEGVKDLFETMIQTMMERYIADYQIEPAVYIGKEKIDCHTSSCC